MQRNSVLEWPEAAPPPPVSDEPRVRLEFFRPGSVRKIVLLDQPQLRYLHWDASLRKHVPCFDGRRTIPDATATSPCPKCLSRDYVGTRRREGYAPAMLLNVGLSCWEQVVAVFTAGGLAQIEDLIATPTDEGGQRPYRGLTLAVVKTQRGGATPMKIEERPRLKPDEMAGGLPPTFNVRPVLFAKWFPDRVCDEPVTQIAPIPLLKRRSRLDMTAELEAIELPTEVLIANLRDTHAKLVAANMPLRAAQIEAQLAVLTDSRAPTPPTTPPPAEAPLPDSPARPAGVSKVQPEPFTAPPPSPSRTRFGTQPNHSPMVPAADVVEDALRRRGIQAKPAEYLTPEDAIEGDRILDFVTAKPSKNGQPKGGAQ